MLPLFHVFHYAFWGGYYRASQHASNSNRPVGHLLSQDLSCANRRHTTSSSTSDPFFSRPLFGALLFPNESSDARDHCANERTFLSWLRLSVYMAVVSVAIVISFHLKSQPTSVEKRIALPVGLIFWLLSIACLVNGLANYIKTVGKYARRKALVQSGWKTQVVSGLCLHTLNNSYFPLANL